MNALYLVGALLLLVILGYPYLIFVVANKQAGATRTMGRAISGLFILTLVVLIILFQTGVVQAPTFRFGSAQPSSRMMRGMSGYVVGMMTEDERLIDEFISTLKSNPTLYEQVKEKLK